MNKSLLEDRQDREQAEAVASALGISADELDQLDWRLEPHQSNDGLLYGHNVYFGKSSDAEILKRVRGLVNGEWVRIGPLPEGE